MLYMALCSFMMILALSEMFRTMTAIGNGSFAGNRFRGRFRLRAK